MSKPVCSVYSHNIIKVIRRPPVLPKQFTNLEVVLISAGVCRGGN